MRLCVCVNVAAASGRVSDLVTTPTMLYFLAFYWLSTYVHVLLINDVILLLSYIPGFRKTRVF